MELQKVIWPTREEVVKLTALVVLVVAFVGLFMFTWGQVVGQFSSRLFVGR